MTAPPFTISPDAVQWRTTWSCESGRLTVATDRDEPLVDGACSEGGEAYGSTTGTVRPRVTARGPWTLVVEQQIDVPLVEPPLPAMSEPGARVVATGSFYRIDENATGTVSVYQLNDGSSALRLDDFFVSPNSDLEIRLSVLPKPEDSETFVAADSELVTVLDVTTGALNFTVPEGIDPMQFSSVVIWCEAVSSAYGAASLEAAG